MKTKNITPKEKVTFEKKVALIEEWIAGYNEDIENVAFSDFPDKMLKSLKEDIETVQAIKEDLYRILVLEGEATMFKDEIEFLKKKLEKIKKGAKK